MDKLVSLNPDRGQGGTPNVRIAVLWMASSGYMDASLRALARAGVEIFLSDRQARSQAPFAEEQFDWLKHRYTFRPVPVLSDLLPRLTAFEPDLLAICSWHIPAYRKIARLYRGRAPRILCMDNQWRGTARQWVGVLARDLYIKPLFDCAWVAGSTSADFARKLGFTQRDIYYGLNTCDHAAFAAACSVQSPERKPHRNFLYVGRLSLREKHSRAGRGLSEIPVQNAHPMAADHLRHGSGSTLALGHRRRGHARVRPSRRSCLAFWHKQAAMSSPARMKRGLVAIHEATTVGLPVICTTSCGASVHLVQDGHNGTLIDPGDADQLAEAMLQFAELPPRRRVMMGENSAILSLQYTPQRGQRRS